MRSRSPVPRSGVMRVALLLWLTLVWVALWGQATVGNIVGGLLVAVALMLVFPLAGPRGLGRVRPLRALYFLGYFISKLIEANLVVAWEVLTPWSRINEGIVAVPVQGASDGVVTLVANAISLTPGTLTLEVKRDPPTLYVHVLHLHDIEDARREVRKLEALALAAFGPAETAAPPPGTPDQRKG